MDRMNYNFVFNSMLQHKSSYEIFKQNLFNKQFWEIFFRKKLIYLKIAFSFTATECMKTPLFEMYPEILGIPE